MRLYYWFHCSLFLALVLIRRMVSFLKTWLLINPAMVSVITLWTYYLVIILWLIPVRLISYPKIKFCFFLVENQQYCECHVSTNNGEWIIIVLWQSRFKNVSRTNQTPSSLSYLSFRDILCCSSKTCKPRCEFHLRSGHGEFLEKSFCEQVKLFYQNIAV